MTITRSLEDTSVDTGAGPVYTFSTQALGAADADRRIVVGIGYTGGSTPRTIVSVTIGGVAADVHSPIQHDAGTTTSGTAIAIAAVPTGTTGDVVVTLNLAATSCGISVYRTLGLAGTAAFDTATNTVDPLVASIDVENGGAIFGHAITSAVTTGGFAWTNLTEDMDGIVQAALSLHSSASDVFPTGELARSITADYSTTSTTACMSLVSFSPADAPPPPTLPKGGMALLGVGA